MKHIINLLSAIKRAKSPSLSVLIWIVVAAVIIAGGIYLHRNVTLTRHILEPTPRTYTKEQVSKIGSDAGKAKIDEINKLYEKDPAAGDSSLDAAYNEVP